MVFIILVGKRPKEALPPGLQHEACPPRGEAEESEEFLSQLGSSQLRGQRRLTAEKVTSKCHSVSARLSVLRDPPGGAPYSVGLGGTEVSAAPVPTT